ncbi:hypothetical protein SAMN05421819_2159 [Bryocella elongata]|uniref:Uncharacterized protein n=1 Tax=Bryocella elongata TaxID=863522 RepID=A0A1H5Y8B0_9BACT|nr:hypothetical protein [Bryocella elongata]SEG19897.1 hypothetical protein SAMN05421819_2159 [Bryocella elongata]
MSVVTEVMAPVVERVRAYFAPVNRAAMQPTIFDPAQEGGFALSAPPAPWVDLGWIRGFARKSGTKVEPVLAGAPLTAQMQVRTEIGATVGFAFESWGKLQLALSCGTQQMNVLKTASGAAMEGSGGAGVSAVPVGTGSTATVLQLGAAASAFSVGELVAVDVDYAGAMGFVGSGVSGAYVRTALTDVDYVRRVTLNVGRISAINTTTGALTLESALVAGAPASGMKVSGVVGFCDREGSSFFQEWSAVFVAEGQQGARVVWHYPRLQAMSGIAESFDKAAGGFEAVRLAASFRALPVKDPVDGETVVCFRSYVGG